MNLPTDSNRPYLFKGKGTSGLARRFGFQFMGYVTQLAQQLSLLMSRHSKDVGSGEAISQLAMMLGVLILAIIVGLANLEATMPLKRLIEGESSSRATLANVIGSGDPKAWGELAAVSMVSMIPYTGELAARMFGGSANRPVFDPTAMIPGVNFINDASSTLTRIGQTGDAVYPMQDFARRWAPPIRVGLNLLGVAEADRASRNTARAISAAAPSSMEQRRPGASRGSGTQTPMTPIIRDLVAAAYDGDAEAVALAYRRAVEEKRRQGTPDAEEAVLSQLQAQVPARKIFGRLPTESEEQAIYSRMKPGQQEDYDRSKAAFDLIARTVGGKIQVVQPPSTERPTFSGASRTRRGTRSLTRSSRSTRTRSRRRSLFGRTRRRSSSSRRSRRRRVTVRA